MTNLMAFERTARTDHSREHGLLINAQGEVVAQRDGDFDSVYFSPIELESACGGVLSHSHPRDLPPSCADLMIAALYGMTLRAVGVAPDTGEQFNHQVTMVGSSEALAEEIQARFDSYVERAEKELATQPMGDMAWQRESRHLAVQRLARDLGFTYQRVQYNVMLSEATQQERARLSVLTSVETTMSDHVFAPLHNDIMRHLSRMAVDGKVPVNQIEQARRVVHTLVQRTILGQATRDGSLHPYLVDRGQVVPRSQYFRVLWGLMREAGTAAAKGHADLMRKYLPADLVRALEYATVDPFDADLSEMDDGPDLSGHDPLHMWTGPDGKRLIDRMWNVASDMYRRLDQFVTGAIARGMPVQQLDRELEQFLVHGKGDYEAMRLARTEVAATYSRVDSASASMNPIVESYQPFTSPAHHHIDVCDEMVAGGPYPVSDTQHLPPYHPFCLCGVTWLVVENVTEAIANLRTRIEKAVANAKKAFTDLIGPLSRRFIDAIFGSRS